MVSLSDWLENWCDSRCGLCFSKQTFNALITTLRAQAHLISDLLEEGYEFVIPGKLQSDPIEKRFSQYRQMSGGNFLVSLREVLDTEKTLLHRSLLKVDANVWELDLLSNNDLSPETVEHLQKLAQEISTEEVSLCSESEEVAVTIAGYVAKKIVKKLSCDECKSILTETSTEVEYFQRLSR